MNVDSIPPEENFLVKGKTMAQLIKIVDILQRRDRNQLYTLYQIDAKALLKDLTNAKQAIMSKDLKNEIEV
jgi:hypothetical protein